MDETHDAVGIDGCKGGWIVATERGVDVLETLQLERFGLVGIDMPIGLDDESPRACDIAARKYLERAGSSVFPAPPRAALACIDYHDALAVARAVTGRGMSIQTFNILAKVAELDRLIDESNQHRIIEVHPECSFKTMNGDKKLSSKKTIDGRDARRRLLNDHFDHLNHFDLPSTAPRGAAIDDMLDAYAVLWSVRRFQRGEHRVFGDGQRDARGIEMRIVC
jgi:predicted RNase H-like nuclease